MEERSASWQRSAGAPARVACGSDDAPRVKASAVADIDHTEGVPTHGEGSQLVFGFPGWGRNW